MTVTEKRTFTRAPFQTKIRVVTDDREAVSHRLKDISLGGALILLEHPL